MKLITVNAYHEMHDEQPAKTFVCVARSAEDAVLLVHKHVGPKSPYKRIESDQEVVDASMHGPAKVLGTTGSAAWTWRAAT